MSEMYSLTLNEFDQLTDVIKRWKATQGTQNPLIRTLTGGMLQPLCVLLGICDVEPTIGAALDLHVPPPPAEDADFALVGEARITTPMPTHMTRVRRQNTERISYDAGGDIIHVHRENGPSPPGVEAFIDQTQGKTHRVVI